MEYTILKLGNLAGVSTRTLRYYDEIGLLKPARVNSSGYRIYGEKEVDLLQQILFYRELGVGLLEIKDILTSPDFDVTASLTKHREKLLAKKMQLEALIRNVDKTLAAVKGGKPMTDSEKFTGFKQKLVEENEAKYGKEIREKYGDKAVDSSNQKLMGMTGQQYEEFENLGKSIERTLKQAIETGDAKGELAQKAADLHRQWLSYTWGNYSKEAHANLARMYVADERFKAYYDKIAPHAAEFLRDAIFAYTGFNTDSK